MISEERRAYWERHHAANLADPQAATGYISTTRTLSDLLKFHRLDEPVGLRICEIGVGAGRMTRELAELGNEVVAVDCCESALRRVRSIADEAVIVDDLPFIKLRECDLVICHLVAQHCSCDEVKFLLRHAPLAEDGLLSMQFCVAKNQRKPLHVNAMTENWRTMDYVLSWLHSLDLVDAGSFYVPLPMSHVDSWVLKARCDG